MHAHEKRQERRQWEMSHTPGSDQPHIEPSLRKQPKRLLRSGVTRIIGIEEERHFSASECLRAPLDLGDLRLRDLVRQDADRTRATVTRPTWTHRLTITVFRDFLKLVVDSQSICK